VPALVTVQLLKNYPVLLVILLLWLKLVAAVKLTNVYLMTTAALNALITSVISKTLETNGTRMKTNVFHASAIAVLSNVLKQAAVQRLVPI
jgi:hypothetical protein